MNPFDKPLLNWEGNEDEHEEWVHEEEGNEPVKKIEETEDKADEPQFTTGHGHSTHYKVLDQPIEHEKEDESKQLL